MSIVDTNRARRRNEIALRRQEVARLVCRQVAQAEIAEQLGVSQGLVSVDLKAIRAQWRENAVAEIAEHHARQLAELFEVKRAAWAQGDLGRVLAALAAERELLGLGSVNLNLAGPGGGPIEI